MTKSKDELIQEKVAKRMSDAEKSQIQKAFEDLDDDAKKVFKKTDQFKSLDKLRSELAIRAEEKRSLHQLGKVTLAIVKDQGEVLMSTSY